MEKGNVIVYYGTGKGKTSAALGYGLRAAAIGKQVTVIQFLKEKIDLEYFKRLEPEVMFFRFARCEECFEDLPKEQLEEEIFNIKNGMHYAKKVLMVEDCNVLILDELLGLLDYSIVTMDDIRDIIAAKPAGVDLVFTGTKLDPALRELADEIYNIGKEKGDAETQAY